MALQDRRDMRTGLKEDIAEVRSHIEALKGAGLDEAIQRQKRELKLTEEHLPRYEREVAVLSLLQTTSRSAVTEAKERYLSPVLKRFRPFLQLLFPDADITIDEKLQIIGVVWHDDYEEPFKHLSRGTKKQIAMLVCLAFAETLVEKGHHATVVLDDASVFGGWTVCSTF